MSKGITFVEIMVVVAIVSTLAMAAYPYYQRSKVESRRADARASLAAYQAAIERYLAENNKTSFTSTDLDLSNFANFKTTATSPGVLSQGKFYRITITAGTPYVLTATATVSGSLTDCNTAANTKLKQCPDTACRELSLNGDNQRTSKNSAGVTANSATTTCW